MVSEGGGGVVTQLISKLTQKTIKCLNKKERVRGIEPPTHGLGSRRSTSELYPQLFIDYF